MAKLLGSELVLVLLTGLFAALGAPWLSGRPASFALFLVGLLMATAFVGLYALANLAGRRLRPAVSLAVGGAALVLTLWRPADGVTHLVGVAAGALLTLLGAAFRRGAGSSLFAYAVPLLAAHYLLLPLLGPVQAARQVAAQCAVFYFFGRGLVRLAAPTSAEGNPEAGPLVHRPVPDRVVGLVEATARRRARPYATRADGSRDEGAISILCPAAEASALADRLREALAAYPVVVTPGPEEEHGAQLVIRMANPHGRAR